MQRILLVALAAAAASGAEAQNAAPRDATSPGAPVAPLEYRSTFAGYQRQAEQPLMPWRAASDGVKPPSKPPAKAPAGERHRGHR